MRRYYIVSGILLTLPIISFAVAAPVLVQEKHQAVVDVVHIPEDVITMLGKRGDELDELLLTFIGVPEDHFPKPESSSAARPSLSSPPSAPAGSTDVKQSLPSIPEEPPPVSSPDHAPPSSDVLDELWLHIFGDPGDDFAKPESSSAARPSSSSLPSGPADGWTDVKQPLPSIPEEPPPVSSPDHAPLSSDVLDELWLHIFGDPGAHFVKPESSSATRPSSSSLPSGPADGWTDVKQPLPPIPEEPSPVSSPDHAPPSPGSLTESGNELMKGDAPPGPSGPASSIMSSADHELMGADALPNPGPSTDSNPEMMDVPPVSSPVSSTNPDRQSMGVDSPSGKRRKMENGLWFANRD